LDENNNFKLELQFYPVLSSNWQPVTSSHHPILIGIIIADLFNLIGKPTGLKRTGGLEWTK